MSDFWMKSPLILSLVATIFTWGVTALGAAIVFFFRNVRHGVLDLMLGFAGGVMIAASFWSLLEPAIGMCQEWNRSPWLAPAVGFLCGGGFIVAADRIFQRKWKSGTDSHLRRSALVATSVTMHNLPEGMVVGVAFAGSAMMGQGIPWEAIALSFGIGLQNFPEGASVALPLRREGLSRGKSFFFGQASGMVEPIGAVIGCTAALLVEGMLPFLLSFSAGAMIAVAAVELIPEAAVHNKDLASLAVMIGFVCMMVLDIALST